MVFTNQVAIFQTRYRSLQPTTSSANKESVSRVRKKKTDKRNLEKTEPEPALKVTALKKDARLKKVCLYWQFTHLISSYSYQPVQITADGSYASLFKILQTTKLSLTVFKLLHSILFSSYFHKQAIADTVNSCPALFV